MGTWSRAEQGRAEYIPGSTLGSVDVVDCKFFFSGSLDRGQGPMGLGVFEEVSVHVFGLGGGFGWNWIGDVGSFFFLFSRIDGKLMGIRA